MAEEFHILTQEYLGIREKIHIVGHDIGGMIAFTYALRYASDVASVIWSEFPLPETSNYEENQPTPALFHFVFHQIRDLPETLIAGKELEYLTHFYHRLAYNSMGITVEDAGFYTLAFSQLLATRRYQGRFGSLPLVRARCGRKQKVVERERESEGPIACDVGRSKWVSKAR
ncbi:Microsomal epoxide hydrolase [Ascochyta rabiei]|uniref:Catalytic n=1 Tax=Didymella rabiei TaxID=5454 RepID=A0A162X5W8_DIDRA|nr:Microsomal epoxide hydrolase [Ascochyta rabiei]KZM19364.1 catalytic [Ascochyta rabiei]UPX12364.1 Microsomal epoxide hydrolase [Ascochyta rabiei]